jgi:hypothetical protein
MPYGFQAKESEKTFPLQRRIFGNDTVRVVSNESRLLVLFVWCVNGGTAGATMERDTQRTETCNVSITFTGDYKTTAENT